MDITPVHIIREAMKQVFSPEEVPPELAGLSDEALLRYYQAGPDMWDGPITAVIITSFGDAPLRDEINTLWLEAIARTEDHAQARDNELYGRPSERERGF